jgi:hypothetical protein
MRDPSPRIRFLREIAFMRNTDHLFHQSKRGGDLGRSGQKRNNPDHFHSTDVISDTTEEGGMKQA